MYSNFVTHTSWIPATFYILLILRVFIFNLHLVAEQLKFHVITNKISLF